MGAGFKSAVAVGAALALIGGTHPHALSAVLDSATVPGPAQRAWARELLREEGLPRTACNVGAVSAWEVAEGGNWSNSAARNPLNTTQPEPGSWPINSVGVQAYPSWRKGLDATVTTLGNGNYPGILSALQAGNDAQAVAGAVASSPWGTGPFQASC